MIAASEAEETKTMKKNTENGTARRLRFRFVFV